MEQKAFSQIPAALNAAGLIIANGTLDSCLKPEDGITADCWQIKGDGPDRNCLIVSITVVKEVWESPVGGQAVMLSLTRGDRATQKVRLKKAFSGPYTFELRCKLTPGTTRVELIADKGLVGNWSEDHKRKKEAKSKLRRRHSSRSLW